MVRDDNADEGCVPAPFANSPEFRWLLDRETDVDLARIALEIAADASPDLAIEAYLERLDGLAARVRERCPASAKPRQVIGQINWVLFVEEQFRGNTEAYYDPRNSYLNDVLDRKLGIPISLSVLYMAVAARVDLDVHGLSLPAHFMVGTRGGAGEILIDPFHGGELLDRAACVRRLSEVSGQPIELPDEAFAPCPPAALVARMLRNLKAVYLGEGNASAALPVMRRLAALEHDNPIESRDFGLICLQAGAPGDALAPLQTYIDAEPHADDRQTVLALLRAARREVASWN